MRSAKNDYTQAVSNPRFQPRDYASGSDFGMYAGIGWKKSVSDKECDRIDAARLQHMYAVAIRSKARARFKTVRAYADTCGVSYDRMAKVLRGEAIMRLEDIAQAERILGGIHRDAMLQIRLANEVDANRRIGIGSTPGQSDRKFE